LGWGGRGRCCWGVLLWGVVVEGGLGNQTGQSPALAEVPCWKVDRGMVVFAVLKGVDWLLEIFLLAQALGFLLNLRQIEILQTWTLKDSWHLLDFDKMSFLKEPLWERLRTIFDARMLVSFCWLHCWL